MAEGMPEQRTTPLLEGPVPSAEELVALAREMRPRLVERSADCERERRIPQETLDELHEAGFFRYYLPASQGGRGGELAGLLDIAAELARGCPSTAWVYTIISEVTALAGVALPPAGIEEIYGSSPRPTACAVNSPGGTARRVEGGYRVTGSWGFASGCQHSDWFGGFVQVSDDADEPEQIMVFVRLAEATIKDTWHVAGLRGTGSHTVVVDDVFVPEHRTFGLRERAQREARFVPDAEVVDRIPAAPFFSLGLMGTLLGIGQEVLELVTANAHKRGVTYFDFEKQTDSSVVLEAIGEAAMQIDTALLHVRRGVHELDETTRFRTLDYVTRARCRADAGHACENLRRAVDSLMSVAGASAFAESNRLQRLWRDLTVGSRHGYLGTRLLYETYGRAFAGVPANITQLV
ncbi:acyl-CoA dehydrogenase family protein [Blastococcus sp. SYSU D00820]